ncbi:hypothetical protein FB480_11812 [Agrobacterium vitis]|nr:hypothetical protein FB480_11812 [Agrobacterium vitis]
MSCHAAKDDFTAISRTKMFSKKRKNLLRINVLACIYR